MRVSVKVEILINKPTDIPYLYLKNRLEIFSGCQASYMETKEKDAWVLNSVQHVGPDLGCVT